MLPVTNRMSLSFYVWPPSTAPAKLKIVARVIVPAACQPFARRSVKNATMRVPIALIYPQLRVEIARQMPGSKTFFSLSSITPAHHPQAKHLGAHEQEYQLTYSSQSGSSKVIHCAEKSLCFSIDFANDWHLLAFAAAAL